MEGAIESPEGRKFACLCHTDCWFNNILFRYHDHQEEPVEALMLDFQTSCYSYPGKMNVCTSSLLGKNGRNYGTYGTALP